METMELTETLTSTPTSRRASESRGRSSVELIVLHSDPRPAEEALASYLENDAEAAPHYYVGAAGTVVTLVPEARAARHSGLAGWRGRRRNIDRHSVGIVAEHTPGSAYGELQQEALYNLVGELRERHALEGERLYWWQPAGQGARRRGSLLAYGLSPDAFLVATPEMIAAMIAESLRFAGIIAEAGEGDDMVLGASADDPAIRAALLQESYAARGEGFQGDWAFHRAAAAADLGAPLTRSANQARFLAFGGQSYGYQPFARDTLYSASSDWSKVYRLSDLTGGKIPGGLGGELLKKVYLECSGSKLEPGWAFHQQAVASGFGPPLSGSYIQAIGGARYNLQVFALETLYTPLATPEAATNWGEVRRLSQTDGPLADGLWAEAYKPCGAAYNPGSELHQAAARAGLGAPLSGERTVPVGGGVSYQVFALDTVFRGPDGVVRRLSELPKVEAAHPITAGQPPARTIAAPAPSPGPAPAPRPGGNGAIPASARRMCDQAISMIGPNEREIFDRLPPNLRRIAFGSNPANASVSGLNYKDIVCADLIAISMAAAGLDYSWRVTIPAGTQKNNPSCANYYRGDHNAKLRILADNDPTWLPGDILLYWKLPRQPATGDANHVDLYVGPFTHNGATFDVVDASINWKDQRSGKVMGLDIKAKTKVSCWDRHFDGYFNFVRRVRLVELEEHYRQAGML